MKIISEQYVLNQVSKINPVNSVNTYHIPDAQNEREIQINMQKAVMKSIEIPTEMAYIEADIVWDKLQSLLSKDGLIQPNIDSQVEVLRNKFKQEKLKS